MAGKWEVTNTTTTKGITTKTATYTVDGKVVATLSGLSESVTASGGAITGITVTEPASGGTGTIGLASGVLTTSNVTLKLAKGSKYALEFVGTVPSGSVNSDITLSVKSGTVTATADLTANYTLKNATSIIYTAPKTAATLATVGGLNTALEQGTDGTIGVTVEGAYTPAVSIDSEKNAIKLTESALAAKKATLKDNAGFGYTLEFDSVPAPTYTDSWTEVSDKGVTTLQADVSKAGYTLSLDGKTVNYTAAGENVKLVTISGVVDNEFTMSDADSTTNTRTITLSKDHLNATNVTISGLPYKLALNQTDPTAEGYVPGSDVATEEQWALSKTTATYKTVKPEYYTYDAATNKVVYTKQADVATLATLSGVKAANTKSNPPVTAEDILEGLTVDGSTITVSEDALGSSNITLKNGTGQNFALALANADKKAPTPTFVRWAYSGTTATLQGKTTEGWTKTSDTTIVYTKEAGTEAKPINLATVKGVKSGLKLNDDKDAVGTNVSETDSETQTVTTTFVSGLSEENGVITVSANVLGTSDVILTPTTGFTYILALDTGTGQDTTGGAVRTAAAEKTFWYNSGANLLLKDGSTNYYTLSADKLTIDQTDEKVGKDVATLSGLKTGLKILADGSINGIVVSGKSITLSEEVLNKKDVSFASNASNYKLYLADEGLVPHTSTTWLVEGTDAILMDCTTEGYKPQNTNSVLKYNKIQAGDPLVTITGLKSGLKVKDNKIAGITVDGFEPDYSNMITIKESGNEPDKTITLEKSVLGTTDVAIDSTAVTRGYQLAVGETVTTISDGSGNITKEWRAGTGKNAGTAYYDVKTTAAGFEEIQGTVDTIEAVNTLAYRKKGTVTTTVTGLAIDDSGSTKTTVIDGLTNPNENGVITLPSTVLGKKNITLKNASGGTYTLALGNGISAPTVDNFKWVPDAKNKTKATLTGDVGEEGYELSEDALTVAYTPTSKGGTLATVTGLKSGLTAAQLEAGIEVEGSVLKLDNSVVGATKMVVSGGNYTFELSDNVPTSAKDATEWVTSGTTATYKTYKVGYYTPDATAKTLKYTKPTAGTTYATLKGIASGADVNAVFTGNTTNGTIALNPTVLGTSNVTLTGKGFKLTFDGSVPTSTENVTEWVTNGTTATYKNYNKAYYTLSGTTSVKYTKPTAGTTYATIKGIASGATIGTSNISTNGDSGTVITLNADQLAGKKVTISGSGYTLALGSDTDKAASLGTYWLQKKKATSATYLEDFSAGYTLANDALSITYSAKPTTTTLATVSGIAVASTEEDKTTREETEVEGVTTYTYDDALNSNIVADPTAKTIKLSSADLFNQRSGDDPKNGAKITLKDNAGKGYTLALDGENLTAPAADDKSLEWTLTKSARTAALKQDISAGVNISADGRTATYAAAKEGVAIATISGLDKAKVNAYFADDENSSSISQDGKTATLENIDGMADLGISAAENSTVITLTSNALLGTGKVTLGKNDTYTFNVSALAPKAGQNKWSVVNLKASTTATYSKTTTDGYNATDTKTVAYVKEVYGDPVVTITGLKKGLSVSEDGQSVGVKTTEKVTDPDTNATTTVTKVPNGITFLTSTKINLKASVLGTSNIELINGEGSNYAFNDIGGNEPGEVKYRWTLGKGTATYKKTQSGGYTLESDNLNVTYTPDSTTTIATVKGLNKTFTGNLTSAIQADDQNYAITIGNDLLSTSKVTVAVPKNSTLYSLKIGADANQVARTATEWVTTKAKAEYKTYDQAYYTIDPNSGAILYHAATKGTTYATVNGIKAGVNINDAFDGGTTGGTITLAAKHLGTSNVTVALPKGSTANFTLALGDDAPKSEAKDTLEWVTSGTKAVYKKYDKGFFTLDSATNKLNYTKGTNDKGTEYATLTGATADITTATLATDEHTLVLSGKELANKISIAGTYDDEGETGVQAFSFQNDYNNAAIVGSKNDDSIIVAGDNLTITGGKGNDSVDFGSASMRNGNTFIYASGDGEDSITNFSSYDSITANKMTATVTGSGTKYTVNFLDKKGEEIEGASITLTGDNIKHIWVNGTDWYEELNESSNKAGSAGLLADDNFTTDPAALSDLVEPATTQLTDYTLNDGLGLTNDKDAAITQITYANDDK